MQETRNRIFEIRELPILLTASMIIFIFMFVYFSNFQPGILQGDEASQIMAARNLVSGNGYSTNSGIVDGTLRLGVVPLTHWPPGYSLILAGLFKCGFSMPASIFTYRLLFLVLSTVLWFIVMKRLGLAEIEKWIFMLFFMLVTTSEMYEGVTDIVEFIISALIVLYIISFNKRGFKLSDTIWISIIISLGIVFRYHSIFWGPMLLTFLACCYSRDKALRDFPIHSFLLIVIPAITYLMVQYLISQGGASSRPLSMPTIFWDNRFVKTLTQMIFIPFTRYTSLDQSVRRFQKLIFLIIVVLVSSNYLLHHRKEKRSVFVSWFTIGTAVNIFLLYITMLFFEQPRIDSDRVSFAVIVERYYTYLFPIYMLVLLQFGRKLPGRVFRIAILTILLASIVYMQVNQFVIIGRNVSQAQNDSEKLSPWFRELTFGNDAPIFYIHNGQIFKLIMYDNLGYCGAINDLNHDYVNLITGKYDTAEPINAIMMVTADTADKYLPFIEQYELQEIPCPGGYRAFYKFIR